MDIKEIVLKAGHSTVPAYWLSDEKPIACSTSNFEKLVSFVEALIAELAKQNEPVESQYKGSDGSWKSFDSKDHESNTRNSGDWEVRDLFAYPPTAEQIANETAEACARYVNRFLNGDGIQDEAWIRDIESGIRRGTWQEFKQS